MKEQSILTSSDLNLEKALTPAVVDAVTELQWIDETCKVMPSKEVLVTVKLGRTKTHKQKKPHLNRENKRSTLKST